MRARILRFVFASLCLVLLPAAAFADGMIVGSCGADVVQGNANPIRVCVLAGGGTAVQGGQAISGVNNFRNNHSPVLVVGVPGQTTTFVMTIVSNPTWNAPGLVPTFLSLNGMVTILQPGATVDISFIGVLGGPALSITGHFDQNANIGVTVFGNQAQSNVAISTLTVTITGAAMFFAPGSGEFSGAIPEPATLLLLGTGLTGVAMKLRKRRRVDKTKAG